MQYTVELLKRRSEELLQKIPTIRESIRNYSELKFEAECQLEVYEKELEQNMEAIDILERRESDDQNSL